ncbi:DUF1554 domain-containing protein [Leptospira noumeaensis]|nr:DUF1554 domain-containing protein [Leptospira noumeaensis]
MIATYIAGLDSQCASDVNKPSSSSTSTYKALVADGTNRITCASANCTNNIWKLVCVEQ